MATSDDLIQDVYANFLSAYTRGTGAGNTIISFEAIGLSPGLDPAAPGSKATALEYISIEADWLPALTGSTYERTMRTISVSYADMVNTALPVTETGAATFNALKAGAVESLHNFDLGSQNGPSTFKPAYAAPANWYDPALTTDWSSYSYTAGTATVPHPRPPITLPIWRMMAVAPPSPVPEVAPPSEVLHSRVNATAAVSERALPINNFVVAQTAASAKPVDMMAERIKTPVSNLKITDRIAIDSAAYHLDPLILNNSGDHPVLQPQFSMSFQYCIVQLTRPWYSGDFLANSGWYVPGQHAGDFASGPSVAPAGTGGATNPTPAAAPAAAANGGYFAWIPVAFIAIKNLLIHSTGGALDPSLTKSVTAFGPFSFAPGSSSDGLSNPGIEIIAWICSAQPQLPPKTDPALIVTPASDQGGISGTVGSIVSVLEDIFGGKKTTP